MTLTEFLTARLDEDEAAAKRFAGKQVWDQIANGGPVPDPRPLREVDAKRKILAAHAVYEMYHDEYCSSCGDVPQVAYPCATVLALAAVWSDHPDYDKGWA